MRFAAVTTVGNVRHENQDSIVVGGTLSAGSDRVLVDGDLTPTPGGALVAVIDGMGGHRGGRQASAAIAGHLLRRAALHRVAVAPGRGGDPAPDGESDERHTRAVHELLTACDDLLHDRMDRDPGLRAMGATIAGLACLPDVTVAFNLGDARVYRYSDRYLQRVSEDDRGPNGNLVQSLGGTVERVALLPHVTTVPVESGVRWLLCSDGLSDHVEFLDIQAELERDEGPVVVTRLLAAALERGSTDNVSIVLLDT